MRLTRGFTLVELLVVIAIIAMLASIVLAVLSQARDKGNYAAVVADLRSTRSAFYLLYEKNQCWPREGNTTCGGYPTGNPSVATLIADSSFGLSQYLSAPPRWPFSSAVWNYDNDGDVLSGACTTSSSAGVNLFISQTSIEYYRVLNTIIDGDPDPDTTAARTCGQIRFTSATTPGDLLYTISPNQQ